ncbi:pyridoxamine 5'-phosphate oxidase family protein [Nocardia rhamnosiphila]|uniref:pyridoxamine 5'-phosphate oxidase family protein n=1 Tax=Nocardia rhamnosiphila TaxID=426716 RepID=UPI0033CCA4BC
MHSVEEKQQYLSEPHVGVLAVGRKDRAPVAMPIWYDYRPGGTVRVWTPRSSAKAHLIAAAGNFSFVVQDVQPPYKFVRAEGPVVSMTDATNDIVREIASRYVSDEEVSQYIEVNEQGGYVIIEMLPERFIGWAE